MAFVRICVSVLEILAVAFLIHSANGEVEFVSFPENIYPIEGEAATVTCKAKGEIGKIEFRRRDKDKIHFDKISNTASVYTTSKTEGDIVTAVLHFTKIEASHESIDSSRRYSCWVFNKTGVQVIAHDFHVFFTEKSSLPEALPNTTVTLNKKLGDFQQLSCNITYPPSAPQTKLLALYWKKGDEIINEVDAIDGKFKEKLDVLTFEKISLDNAGIYTCIVRTKLRDARDYNVTGGPFIVNIIPEIDKSKRKGTTMKIKKGELAKFECAAVGYPLALEWKVKLKYETVWRTVDKSPCNESRLCINEKESTLEIKDVQYSDRGFYNCCVVSSYIKEKNLCQEFILRVRDPLGPLWPVIGIVVEAILLFLIIYFTQKKKRSKPAAESTDGRVEFSYSSTDEGDRGHVRLRPNAEKGDTPKDV